MERRTDSKHPKKKYPINYRSTPGIKLHWAIVSCSTYNNSNNKKRQKRGKKKELFPNPENVGECGTQKETPLHENLIKTSTFAMRSHAESTPHTHAS